MAYENNTGYPSVTEILSPFIDKEWFTEESRKRGSAVHSACSAHLSGAYVPPLDPDHQPYFDSFRRWADTAIDSVVLTEERLSDPVLGYCGQPDMVAILNGDKQSSIIDLKTSQSFYDWFPVQLAGYDHLILESKEIVVARKLSAILKKDGSGCRVKEYSGPTHWNVFRSALNCFKYFGGK